MKSNGQLIADVQELKRTARTLKIALCKLMYGMGYSMDAISKEILVPQPTVWRWLSGYDEKKTAERHAAKDKRVVYETGSM